MIQDTDRTDVPLAEVCAAAGGELHALALRCQGLQETLGALLAETGHRLDLQDLDGITQGLEGVATFLDAIAMAAPPGWRIDAQAAAANLTLADLAAGLGRLPPPTERSTPAGDLELFG